MSCLSAVCCVLVGLIAQAESEAPAPVIRSYDVADLIGPCLVASDVLHTFPYWEGSGFSSASSWAGLAHALPSAADLAGLVRACVCPEGSEEDAVVLAADEALGPLLVTAPARVHATVAALLAALRDDAAGTHTLEVKVIAGIGSGAGAGLAVQSVARADQRIDELIRAGGARVARAGACGLREGAVARLEALDSALFLSDWDVEIAQAGVISQPIVMSHDVGLVLLARGSAVPGATRLDLAVRYSEMAGATLRRTLKSIETIRGEQSIDRREVDLVVEHPRMSFATFGGTVLIPDGMAVWIPFRLRVESAEVECAFDLRVTGAPRAASPLRELPDRDPEDGESGLSILVMSGGHVGEGLGSLPFEPDCFESIPGTCSTMPTLSLEEGGGPAGARLEALLEQALPDIYEHPGVALRPLGARLALIAPRETAARAAEVAAALGRPPQAVLVHARVLRGEDEVVAEARAPAVLGRRLSLWSGTQVNLLRDWDVDVANDASIPNPNFSASIDGYGMELLIDRQGDGAYSLRLLARVNLHSGDLVVDECGGNHSPTIEKYRTESLLIDDTRVVPAGGQPAVQRWGGRELRVEVELLPQ
ncbi:MAG: hypothetical protein HY812_04410 [Planctomycetes bacterium]|nr:hypothetical protein [Planctomycetota bacterium]